MVYNKHILSGSGLPSLSPKYPWFVAQKEDDDDDKVHTFYNLHDPMSYYRCQIPELIGKRIRGCFHGCWMLLSSNRPLDVMWSIWNPFTCQIINLPPLIHHTGDDGGIRYCCLSAPPDHPNSVLFLTRSNEPVILCCRIGNASQRRWTEKSFGVDGFYCLFHHLTCCNTKVYVVFRIYLNFDKNYLVEVDVVANKEDEEEEEEFVIRLLPVCELPCPDIVDSRDIPILKGSCTELYVIFLGLIDVECIVTPSVVTDVYVFKLDMNNKTWEEMEDVKDIIFTVELEIADDDFELPDGDTTASSFYSPAIFSSAGLGGYVHMLADKGKILYSYNIKDKTLSLSSVPCLSGTNHHVSAWAMLTNRLESDCKQGIKAFDKLDEIKNENVANSKQEGDKDVKKCGDEDDESHLLNLPSHVLEMLMDDFCGGVEYFKFRSTCKRCHLASPLIPCNNEKRLQLLSPWLIVFDKRKSIITFTDPIFGDKYFIKTPQELICSIEIKGCKYGWLLIKKSRCGSLVFYNPFTSDIRELPQLDKSNIFCFSAPPTSRDCIVVGITNEDYSVCILHFKGGRGSPSSWRKILLDYSHDGDALLFLTFYGRDVYALRDDRRLDVFEKIGGKEVHYWNRNVANAPLTSSFPQQSFLLRCDKHDLLHVLVGKFGESVEVFKLKNNNNNDSENWVKINCLGKHAIFICGSSSFCVDAKTRDMENKIYFPRLSTDQNDNRNDNNILFYSLETHRYHTTINQESFGDFFGTKQLLEPHAWIEPTSS